MNPVCLLPAGMFNVSDNSLAIGEGRDGRQGQRSIGECVHIHVNPVQTFRSADFDAIGSGVHLTSHLFQDAHELDIALHGIEMQMFHLDAPTGKRGGGEKIGGTGGIRLNLILARLI